MLDQVRVVRVTAPDECRRFQQLLKQHHYLGSRKAVGEPLYYAAVDAQGHWVALLLFSAVAKHLKAPRLVAWLDALRSWCQQQTFSSMWSLLQR